MGGYLIIMEAMCVICKEKFTHLGKLYMDKYPVSEDGTFISDEFLGDLIICDKCATAWMPIAKKFDSLIEFYYLVLFGMVD